MNTFSLRPWVGVHEDVLAITRRPSAAITSQALRCAKELAANLGAAGDARTGQNLEEETHARYLKVFGDDHPGTHKKMARELNGGE
jgi:hypothetical protein